MINHVEIYILDWKKELKFWEKILKITGFKILKIWKTGFSVGVEKSYISFNQTKNTSFFKIINIGINQIAVVSKMNKTQVIEALKQNKIKILYLNKIENNIYIENDWGLKIEIIVQS